MQIYQGLEETAQATLRRPLALTIGVFDGVHRGHQALLAALVGLARQGGGDAAVLTFDRHPREIIEGVGPAKITSLQHRLMLFERAGVDLSIVLPFDAARASCPAEEFLQELAESVAPEQLLLGANHHFGKDREGNAAFAAARAERFGYRFTRFDLAHDLGHDGEVPISSTRIRKAVSEGRLADAARMLGRPVALLGDTVEGDKRGRTIGFPTANLNLHGEVRPPRGVYVAELRIEGDLKPRLALVNIGQRPTFYEQGQDLVEAHVLDFAGDLYGQTLELSFLERLRDERRFSGLEALKAQLEKDREQALAMYGAKYLLKAIDTETDGSIISVPQDRTGSSVGRATD